MDKDNLKSEQQCAIHNVRQRAFSWWNKLTLSQKRDYENKTYSVGEWYEDNSLCDDSIIHMYKKWVLHVT